MVPTSLDTIVKDQEPEEKWKGSGWGKGALQKKQIFDSNEEQISQAENTSERQGKDGLERL